MLNLSDDHLGIGDIDTLEDMAKVKSVVAEATSPNGYVVLNADDPLVYNMAKRVKAKVAFFSMNPWNPIVWEHVRDGGLAAIYEDGSLVILTGQEVIPVERAMNIPMTLNGMAPFMIANALAATLAAYVQGVHVEDISAALQTFEASVDHTPGRMNLIPVGEFHVLLDYAHNPASYEALASFVCNWSAGERIGVIGAPGDRRDQDLRKLGQIAVQMFDRVTIKEDDDTRGRRRGEVADLIRTGIRQENPDFHYETVLSEVEAIGTALLKATADSLVVILPESVNRALNLIEQPLKVNANVQSLKLISEKRD